MKRINEKKAVLIHEVHDMWPATLVEMGGMKRSNPFVVILQIAENSAYRNSDAVVSILPNTEPYMREHGLTAGKFCCITNGIVREDWDSPDPLPEKQKRALEKIKREGKFIVGYFGTHGLSNALDVLVDAAKILQDITNDISIVLVGDGPEKTHLRERINVEKITNITMLDSVPKKSIPNLLSLIDCTYAGTMDSTLYRFGLSNNKYYDSMMAGKPIILSTNAKNTVIETAGCGIIVPANDKEGIAEAILCMFHYKKEERCAIGEKGKCEVLEKYTYDKLAESFENVMDNLMECDKPSKKKILYIEHYAGSVDMGMEYRPYYLAREWIKKGHSVDIIAADFSHLRKKNPIIKKDFEEEIIDGIHYHWIHTGIYERNGIKRALTMFSFVGKLLLHSRMIANRFKPDIIITSSTYPLDTYAGQRIRKRIFQQL